MFPKFNFIISGVNPKNILILYPYLISTCSTASSVRPASRSPSYHTATGSTPTPNNPKISPPPASSKPGTSASTSSTPPRHTVGIILRRRRRGGEADRCRPARPRPPQTPLRPHHQDFLRDKGTHPQHPRTIQKAHHRGTPRLTQAP